jgi:phosphatidylserine/phosphatidylglycerophosphate/cardiolipin synthase-like enzyme
MSTAPELLVGYDAFIDALCAELDDTHAGDRVEYRTYILEPGDSSDRVLDGFVRAAERGVQLSLDVDWTAGSHLSRAWERTGTLIPRVLGLADRFEHVTARKRRVPDHSKSILFRRAQSPTALFGGCNLGDRFRPWKDFMVRVRGDLVDQVRVAISDDRPDPAPFDAGAQTSLISNTPRTGAFAVKPALEALFADDDLVRFHLAVAYIDRTGGALIERALARGAKVRLVVPAQANVYHHANLRALKALQADGLEVRVAKGMLHAKAFVAERASGERAAWVGSANLKRNSFRLFGELCVFTLDATFAGDLERAIASFDDGPLEAPRFNPLYAAVEERFG